MAGLQALEYRGYDSAGLTLLQDGDSHTTRAVGPLKALRERVNGAAPTAHSGIAHTRWATHGRVTEENCHPHDDASGRVHVVMNGIVENWTDLKKDLMAEGVEFSSETDTEVVAHLIASLYDGDIEAAIREAFKPCAATTRSWPCTPRSPTCWWAPATSARSWWESARARTSSPPPSRPSWPTPAGSS